MTRHVHIGGRKYLLSGIVRCGSCGALMQGNANTKWGTFSYACKLPTAGGGCGRVSITGPRLKRDDHRPGERLPCGRRGSTNSDAKQSSD